MTGYNLLGPDQPPMKGQQADLWRLAAEPWQITPLDAKAVYVAGMVRHLVESAGLCLTELRELPAYLLTMDAVELLGAAIHERENGSDEHAARGLGFLIEASEDIERTAVFEKTSYGIYSISDCINRRHFAAHGGRKHESGTVLNHDLTVCLMCRLADGLNRLVGRAPDQAIMS